MQWIELTIKTAPAAIDLVCDRLTVLGFDSFIIDDQEQFHEFLEQNRQYWDYVDEDLEKQMQGLSQIRLYLEQNASVPETVESLKSQLAALRAQYPTVDFGSLDVQLANVKDEDWENNWKRYYQPLPIGERLLVVPEWLHPENPENRVEVLLDPGMIFGTGAHASTQMCMRELERAIQGGERVLDLGSGGQDRFKWIVLCVGGRFRRLRGALELLRFVKIHAVWRIYDVAAQIADARENEQAEQNDGQQRDQRNAPQRPLVAVGKNTHGVLLPPVTLPAARRSHGTSPPAVRWR